MADEPSTAGQITRRAEPDAGPGRVSRRGLLIGGASSAAVLVVSGGALVARDREQAAVRATTAADAQRASTAVGVATEPFYGLHQPGVDTSPQACATFAAFDLLPGADRAALGRLMRILTDDIARIMTGAPALADTAPQLAAAPARVTVTVGYGPTLFTKTGLAGQQPAGFIELPAFPKIDALQPEYSGGDFLLQVCSDDAVTTSHTLRMLLKDTRAFATPRWFQPGFRHARGTEAAGASTRNLMGQIDGTVNPADPADFDRLVWHPGPGWFTGGTTLVLRRIRMNLDSWDALTPTEMEEAVGRRLTNGAPLSGTDEHDEPDFTTPDAAGLPAIAPFAHIRQARGAGTAPQILRRPYNYDNTPDRRGKSDLGLLFTAYQASITDQYLPVQTRLAAGDLLNQWTTPIGSAVFAIPPGCQPGGWIGQGLLT